ncbi:uncharacterized protein PHACADRAFT_103523 [Phanerochaete carnosa HHB-10118-sp]|uniref:Uncharacterized protein n=1 Tax=Phanerochaete carnosa (strain HHB-10118-sp) TaxID=650164 RepID=K5WLN7_PHACS|nr:uncharacterized protein PHACADRAFT_103523 [Phanerochaete carnosa HHB-10118-sp]EKM51207.1 hypothetical protein PHACADRAFT_103523 [Phanerochaete carnosa HHB-10118-sp]
MPAFRFPDSDSSLARDSTSGSHVATHGHSFAPGARYPAFSGAHSDHRLSAGTHPALISATFAPGMVQDAPPLPSTSDLSGRPPGHQPSDRNHDQPNTRNSYNTTTTFSSDLSSIPIVEASHGTVRQVLGVARAAVVRTPKPSLSSIHPSLHIRRLSGTKSTLGVPAERPPPVPSSPLARFDFPRVLEESKEEEDPFRDRTPSPVPSRRAADRRAITQSTGTFGDSGTQRWPPPRARKRGGSAPDNNVVEQGSVSTPTSASPRRSTHNDVAPQMLAPPHSMDVPLTPASARHDMLAVPGEERRRDTTSDASVLSATSSFAESLLSSFPFVPPSPPGSFNARTPPRSPQASRSFNGSGSTDVLAADPVLPRIASSTSSSSSGTHRSSFTGDSTRSPSFPNRRMDGSRLSTDQDFRS